MALLFEDLPRTPRRIMMHVIDAGGGWEVAASISEARRGIPCHNCNKGK